MQELGSQLIMIKLELEFDMNKASQVNNPTFFLEYEKPHSQAKRMKGQ